MGIQDFILNFLYFINWVLIPFMLAIALLVFIWNIVRYFVIGGANEQSRESARRLAFYGILGFVFILSVWGIVNLLVYSLGFNRTQSLTPDYLQQYEGDGYDVEFEVGGYVGGNAMRNY
jgi:hypothetical protein